MKYSQEDSARAGGGGLLRRLRESARYLVEIVNRHVADQVMQLMYWNTGTFRLVVPATPIRFAVVPSVDVENLLLEAYRRVDEGERPRREKVSVDEEFCLTCTLDCSAEIKSRYLKPDVCLWRSMPSVLKDPIFRSLRRRDDARRGRHGRALLSLTLHACDASSVWAASPANTRRSGGTTKVSCGPT